MKKVLTLSIVSILIILNFSGCKVNKPEKTGTITSWIRTYNAGLCNLLEVEDGFLVVGFVKSSKDKQNNFLLMKLDSKGNEQWARAFREEGADSTYIRDILETASKGFIVTGSFGVAKVDSNGNMEWSKKFARSSILSVYPNENGRFTVLSATSFSTALINPFVTEISLDGTLNKFNFAKQFLAPIEPFNKFSKTSDGGYIISGPYDEQSSFIAKLNSDGEVSGGCNYIKDYATKYLNYTASNVDEETTKAIVSSLDIQSVPVKIEESSVQVNSTLICDKSLKKVIILQVDSSEISVNGAKKSIDTKPVMKDGAILIPAEEVLKVLVATMSFDKNNAKGTIIFQDRTIEFWVGKNGYKINDANINTFDPLHPNAVPEIAESAVLLPLRFFKDAIGCKTDFDSKTRIITIIYPAS